MDTKTLEIKSLMDTSDKKLIGVIVSVKNITKDTISFKESFSGINIKIKTTKKAKEILSKVKKADGYISKHDPENFNLFFGYRYRLFG